MDIDTMENKKDEKIDEDSLMDALILRSYQIALVDVCNRKNSIIFLPTGSGKTCIAIHALKFLGQKLSGTLESGGKRALMLVPTKALVFQQSLYLRRQTPFSVSTYVGDDGVDFWPRQKWRKEFENNQVLVMTPTIAQNLLTHSHVTLEIFALIIVDECHNGVNDHAYRQIMKEQEGLAEELRPRIIGLTATLLNRTVSVHKVAEEFESLERTFHGQVITCDELSEVLKFSADPLIRIVTYSSIESYSNLLAASQEECLNMLTLVEVNEKEDARAGTPSGYIKVIPPSMKRLINRAFCDINSLIDDLGVYGGSVVVLYYLLEYEQKRMTCDSEIKELVYSQVVGSLHQMRSVLMRIMSDDDGVQSILQYSSSKVIALLDYLKENTDDKQMAATIIFVQRRTMAVTLAHILKKLGSCQESGMGFLRSSFIVGGRSNPLLRSKESVLETKWMQRTLKEFTSGEINTLLATSVVEEGVDIPICNRVVIFNMHGLHYRSFVQSKGRARAKTGEFVIIVPENDRAKVQQNIENYQNIESTLYKLLLGKNELRSAPSPQCIKDDVYSDLVESYFVAGPGSPHVTGITAIPLIMRYCQRLPHDLFSQLLPSYFLKKVKIEEQMECCAIQLPINSPVRQIIQGKPMRSIRLAKRSAFVEAVRILHQAGELTDELKPKSFSVESSENLQWLFPHYRTDTLKDPTICIGSKNRRQIYDIKYPSALIDCMPTVENKCYLHVMVFTPAYEEPVSNRLKVFHQLLSSPASYAVLSSKPLRQICDFPLYLSSGEICCTLLSSVNTVQLSDDQIQQISIFHYQLFSSVLECTKSFLKMHRKNMENSYFLVPVTKIKENYEIDWNVIQDIDQLTSKVDADPSNMVINRKSHNQTVVSPFYRNDLVYYIVTDVCESLSPRSPFPDNSDLTFKSYFKEKYNQDIVNLDQPLLEVKQLPNLRRNFIRPRTNQTGGIRSKRKMQSDGENFSELLVAELCEQFRYPAVLWLKAELLPTTLHRITELLRLEELHRCIGKKLGIIGKPNTWAPLVPDPCSLVYEDNMMSSPTTKSFNLPRMAKKVNVPAAALWDEKNEPIHIWRYMDEVADCDLKHYVEFTRQIVATEKKSSVQISTGLISPKPAPILKLRVIDSSQKLRKSQGPELVELLAATTAKSANDIVDLEKLETLGDSFLKFAVTIFLFRQFPTYNEGELTNIKGKLVSNRNLLYCGQAKDIPALIQAQEFVAVGEWVPPMFGVPNEVIQMIKHENKDPSVLHSMYIPISEQVSGQLHAKTLDKMLEQVIKADVIKQEMLLGRSLSFLRQKVLRDKGVADCVEAIIGVYVMACGLEGGFQLLNWFDVLPQGSDHIELLSKPAPSAMLQSNYQSNVLTPLKRIQYENLERTLNYEFKDKSFLLQALTHPTFVFHRATDCYQRLEFLGDAVLDFLVTCFINQEAPHLDPGEITILRSALVNNTTFGSLCVRYGFHRYMLSVCAPLDDAIADFVDLQEGRNHVVDEAVFLLLEEADCLIAQSVDVPKALGDLFESLAGAIFLDSGNSLETVWNVFYPLMKTELDTFPEKIPRNSIQLIHELNTKTLNVTTQVLNNGKHIRARIDINLPSGEIVSTYGFGPNKFEAKRSAAKLALKQYYKDVEVSGVGKKPLSITV